MAEATGPGTILRRLFAGFLVGLCLSGCGPAETPDAPLAENPVPPPATAAVAVADAYGAQVAEGVLSRGGNAVDAAVAVGFSLAVTYPIAGNIGGGGFMLTFMDGEADFLDYREKAPLAADRDMYLDADGGVSDKASLIGGRAVGVPGTVAGLWGAHQRYGSLPWRELVMPAVELAEKGFEPHPKLVAEVEEQRDWFGDDTDFFAHFSGMQAGQPFRQPELAATLRRIAESGPDDFYRSETAALLLAQMPRSRGLITAADLESYEALWRQPLRTWWRDFEIVTAPPPSSGGFAVIQLLKMKDYLAHYFEDVAHNSPQYIHLVAEMEKRVFADRAEYLGDPDFVDNRIGELIDDDYIARRALEVQPDSISEVPAVQPGLEPPNTTHYSIVDQWGNAVANTYTLNWDFGSGVVVEGAGFLLNNEMDDFSAKPGVPNKYGVVGSMANEIQPGKRMLSSMSPTLLLRDGEVEMVVGTPGGSTIFTTVFQVIANIVDYGMTPLEAADATRFHHQLLPPDLITYSVTRPLPAETVSALGDRGYRARPHDWEFGNVQIILRDGEVLVPASDPRSYGESRVVEHGD